jgi:hypothetical protein
MQYVEQMFHFFLRVKSAAGIEKVMWSWQSSMVMILRETKYFKIYRLKKYENFENILTRFLNSNANQILTVFSNSNVFIAKKSFCRQKLTVFKILNNWKFWLKHFKFFNSESFQNLKNSMLILSMKLLNTKKFTWHNMVMDTSQFLVIWTNKKRD